MGKLIAKFDTVAVNPAIDSEGGYMLRLKDRPVYDESQVFAEVVKEKTLPFDKDMLEFAFLSVLKTMAQKVAADCNPRKVGNYLKFTPVLRGKLTSPYGQFDRATCNCAIVASSLSGLEREVDSGNVAFVNVKVGTKVAIDRISWIGSDEPGVVKKNVSFAAYGTNLQYSSAFGDSVSVSWKDAEGTEHSAALAPTESDYSHMKFAWPGELDGVAADTELAFVFRTHGGLEDGDLQTNTKKAVVIAD